MAITITLTEEGYRTMLTKGLSSSITKYSVGDQYKIYGLNALPTLPPFTGTKSTLSNANPSCNLAGYKGIPKDPLPTDIAENINSRVGVKIFSSECDGGFDLNTVNIKFHVNRYFNYLNTFLTQDYNFSHEGLTQDLYDYVYATLEQEDVVNGGFNTIENVQILDIRVDFDSNLDKQNYLNFSNRYVSILPNGVSRLSNTRNSLLYSSPFQLNFSSYNAGSVGIPGSGLKLSMMPDEFGYTIDDNYYKLTDANNLITQNGVNSFEKIIPTAKLKNVSYYLTDSNNYNTVDPLLGQFVYGFKTADNTKTLIEGLIERATLYIKTSGTLVDGVYKLPINYNFEMAGNKEFNLAYNNNNYGGNVNLEFVYDSTDLTTTNITEIN